MKQIQMILLIIESILAVLFLILEFLFPQILLGIIAGIFLGLLCGNIIGIIFSSGTTTTPQKSQTTPKTKLSTSISKVNEVKLVKTPPVSPPTTTLTVANPSTTRAISNKSELMSKILKLSEIVESCQDLVENESELSKKEETKLYLRRDEFKKLFREVKSTNIDSF